MEAAGLLLQVSHMWRDGEREADLPLSIFVNSSARLTKILIYTGIF